MKLVNKRESRLPFQNFLTAHLVFALLEKDVEQGIYSQFSCFYRKTFLRGASIKQTKMFDYPDLISGVQYCQNHAKYDLWAFGLIVGAKGKDTDLAMVTCCGGRRSEDLITISQPFELIDHRVRFQGSPMFRRNTKPPSAEEAEMWTKNFSAK